MLAAVLTDFNRLELQELPVPQLGMNEVAVRIRACGICATDYKAIKGIRTNVTFPFIAGHEAAGPIEAVKLMVELRRRGTRWNVFGITMHETFELDGGLTHYLEGRMDASFGTTPLAMLKAIRLMERGLVNPEAIITHRFALADIHEAIRVMGQKERNKVIINP